MNYDQFLSDAFDMAHAAGEILLRHFRNRHLEQTTKLNDCDVVTIADKESEAAIIDIIRHRYPSHGILSEEYGAERSDSEWRWVIDPLDGTTSYTAGLPVFCVSIALEHNEEAVVGVVHAPYLRETYTAIKGHGARLNGEAVRCSEQTQLSKAVLATGTPYDRSVCADNNFAEIERMAMKVRGIRRMGSAAIDLSYVGAGFFDAYWELNLQRWDVAAGMLIAAEGGAVIKSIRENRNHSLLVSNPSLIDEVSKVLWLP